MAPVLSSDPEGVDVQDSIQIVGSIYNVKCELIGDEGLWEDGLFGAVRYTENGNEADVWAWTGTQTDGTPSGKDCVGWNDTGESGTVGEPLADAFEWLDVAAFTCNEGAHLYCISQL